MEQALIGAGQTLGGEGVKGGRKVVRVQEGLGERGCGAAERQTHPSKGQEKMDVYHYLSTKYGTPGEQLNELAARGTFVTTQRIDGGYCVRSPVEANILLPTPYHIQPVRPDGNPVKPVRLVEEPLYQPTPSASSEGQASFLPLGRSLVVGHQITECLSPDLGDGRLRHTSSCGSGRGGQVVFTSSCTELGAAVAGGNGQLRFESRFESGNLRHAVQM